MSPRKDLRKAQIDDDGVFRDSIPLLPRQRGEKAVFLRDAFGGGQRIFLVVLTESGIGTVPGSFEWLHC
jgi:hypothetical protein